MKPQMSARGALYLLGIVSCFIIIQVNSKPLTKERTLSEGDFTDHMLAIPSEHRPIELSPSQAYQARQEVRYEYQVSSEQENNDGRQAGSQQHEDQPTDMRNIEYPNEIVYMNQDADRPSEPSYTTDEHSHSEAPDQSPRLSDSILAATILTEVPMRDLPEEVLDNLKREYGVKVVATRDRPGAELVINCDEYSNREVSICSRQHESRHPQPEEYVNSSPEEASSPKSSGEPQVQQQVTRDNQNTEQEANIESYNGQVANREAEEAYGYRSNPGTTENPVELVDESHSAHPTNQEETHEESSQPEKNQEEQKEQKQSRS